MQEKHLFEYAVIRVVPRVEREEFINVGVILFCAAQKFLQAKTLLDKDRITAFAPLLDLQEVECRLAAFSQVCAGGKEGGSIGQLTPVTRFRWLTANRSTIIQTSNAHPGLCVDAAATLDKLFKQLVR